MNLHTVCFHTKGRLTARKLSFFAISVITNFCQFFHSSSSPFQHHFLIFHLSSFPSCHLSSLLCSVRCFFLLTGSSLLCNSSIRLFTNWSIYVIYFSVRQYIAFSWVACFINICLRSLLTIISLIQLMFNEPKLLDFKFFPFEIIYVNISYIYFVKNTFSITSFSFYR